MRDLIAVSAFTVAQSLCSTAVALLVGMAASFFTARRDFFGRRLLLSLSSVPLCVPTLLVALGFVSFFGMSGTLNTILKNLLGTDKPPVTFLYSFVGIVVAQGFYNFPLVMVTINDAWTRIPGGQAEAARLLGAGEARVFRTVTVFQLMPAVVSSCTLVFLYCFFSFLIILLFGGVGCTTLEVEIYKSARATLDFAETARLAAAETAIAGLFVSLYAVLERKSAKSRGVAFHQRNAGRRIGGGCERIFFFLVIALILLFFIAPILSILYNAVSSPKSALTAATLVRAVSMRGFAQSLVTTVLVALATSILCVIVAFFYSAFLRSFDASGRITALRILPMIPMALSSVVTGVLITMAVRRGTVAHLIAAQVLLTWPLAFRQIHAALSKIHQETVDAARILGRKKSDLLLRIYLPQSWRGILSAAGFCFAASAGDTTLPLVLALPKFTTLSLFTYRLAGAYRFHEACASGLILGALCMGVFALANRLKGADYVL